MWYFRRLRKIEKKWLLDSLCLSFSLSVRLPSAPTGQFFLSNLMFEYFWKNLLKKLQFRWNRTRIKTCARLWSIAEFLTEWEIFRTEVVDKIKTHFIFNNVFFENRAVCEIMWINIVEPERPQMTIWRVGIAFRIQLRNSRCYLNRAFY